MYMRIKNTWMRIVARYNISGYFQRWYYYSNVYEHTKHVFDNYVS